MSQNIELKHINEKEIWVGENKNSIIEGNIIHVIATGEQTTEIAILHQEACSKLSSQIEGKVNYLFNLNKCGKNSTEARGIWKTFTEHENTSKVATYGINPVARVIASFVIGVTSQKKIRFFSTKEEALSWIKK